MNSKKITAETVAVDGGLLCLNFANTLDWSERDEPLGPETDALANVDALLRWGRRLGLYGERELRAARAASDAGDGARELAVAKELRGAVHRSFAAIARGDAPAAGDLERVRRDYRDAVAAGQLAADGREAGGTGPGGADRPAAAEADRLVAAWRLAWPAAELGRVRFAVAASAVELLGDPGALARVKLCPGRHCGSLFHDAGGRRRWCSMATCGSRAKMRRHYARRKGLRE